MSEPEPEPVRWSQAAAGPVLSGREVIRTRYPSDAFSVSASPPRGMRHCYCLP